MSANVPAEQDPDPVAEACDGNDYAIDGDVYGCQCAVEVIHHTPQRFIDGGGCLPQEARRADSHGISVDDALETSTGHMARRRDRTRRLSRPGATEAVGQRM